MWHHKLHKGGALGPKTLADVGSGAGMGIAALSSALTINGQTVSPTFRYEAKNATELLWTATVGNDLPGSGTGALLDQDTPMLSMADMAVDMNSGTQTWVDSGTTFGDLGTDDFVIEGVVKSSDTANSVIARKLAATGWNLYMISGKIVANIIDSTTSLFPQTAVLPSGVWFHFIAFFDRSGSARFYTNGRAGSAFNISTASGSLDVVTAFSIGDGAADDHSIAYLALWQRDNWLDSHNQAALANERISRLEGTWTNFFNAGPDRSLVRNSVATLEKQDQNGLQKLFQVGAGWSRTEKRPDKNQRYGTGYRSEEQQTNLLTYSEQLNNAAWTKQRTTIDANTAVAPDGTTTMDTIVEDATASNTHYIEQSFTQSASAYTLLSVVQAASRRWIQLELSSSTDGAASAYFDTGSGVIGTQSNNDNAGVRYLGGGRYLVWLTDTRATAEACAARAYLADSNGGRSYSGASLDGVYCWGLQITATAYPVSIIKTEGATVTRLKDTLQYTGLSFGSGYTLACDHLSTDVVDGSHVLGEISDGSGANRLSLYRSGSGKVLLLTSGGATQASIGGTINFESEQWQEYRGTAQEDDVAAYMDGVADGTDALATMPVSPNELNIGAYFDATSQLNGLVRVRLLSEPTIKNVTDFGAIMSQAAGYISSSSATAQSTSYANVGGTFTSVNLTDFTMSAAGVFTYTGSSTKRFVVSAACSGSIDSGTPLVTTVIEKNGTPVTSSEEERKVATTNVGAWPIQGTVELANGDTINLATKVDSGTPNLTMTRMSVVIHEE